EHQERDLLRERRDSEEQRRARQVVHQPARRDHLQPAADLRHALAGEEPAEVAVPQGSQAVRQLHLRPRSFCSCSWSLSNSCWLLARRLRTSSTTCAGARSTNDGLASWFFALPISPSTRAISWEIRSASSAGSTSLNSMMGASPTTATGAVESGSTLISLISLKRARA